LGHPVIDNDGHILEIVPVLAEFVAEVGGKAAADKYLATTASSRASSYGKRRTATMEQRRDSWIGQTSFWSHTANTYDRATSLAPRLLVERLGELGIDFGILYPTEGLYANRIEDDAELRQMVCRAVNLYQVELFKGCERHLAPVAVIPCATPEEAIAELDFAVTSLGYRTALLTSGTRREIPKYAREHADVSSLFRRMDFYALDSEYDYDPLWQRLVDLGIPASFHGQTLGTWFGPLSVSNNSFNRLSAIGYSYPALLLAFFLGGTVARFPKLKFMFQEGGAGWISSLYCSLFGVWEKRRGGVIENYNPENLNIAELTSLISRYGTDRDRGHLDWISDLKADLVAPEVLDDFAATGAATPEQFRDLFVEHFYAGCEADDFTAGFAFSSLPAGAQLRTTFGSDIGHWDVSDALDCLPEAYELVEHDILTPEQLKSFLFSNAYEFYTSNNPDFFVGTVLERCSSDK
jgi:predicted TIM-barrel fold metal-dependent hydrolase